MIGLAVWARTVLRLAKYDNWETAAPSDTATKGKLGPIPFKMTLTGLEVGARLRAIFTA